jgi:hypothetical protein
VAIPPVVPAPVAPPPAPPRRAPLPAPAIPQAAEAPATNHAVIVFANIPGSDCGACETVKISVTPGGQVLIEHSFAAADKRYKRQMARVSPARAAAFAARLAAYRSAQAQADADAIACPAAPTREDGVMVEWIEAGRDDRFAFAFRCAPRAASPLAEALRRAPDALGLGQLVFPWAR